VKKVMVVDDDPATLDLMDILLKEGGYETVLLPTSDGVPERVAAERPDLIFLDILIEPKHGMEVVTALSEMDDRPPIILISAAVRGVPEMTQIARALGCQDFVEKPFEVDELMSKVRAVIGAAS
jgi:DNA-binding response OmpR family regulator